ncbi:MAG: hypothetical protein PVJ69_12140 [Desulfobacteraceae bacterium]|jgi:hypothetical protein
MAKEKHKEEMMYCPVGKFFWDMQKGSRKRSKFFDHMDQSRVEFLKAIRSLVDERIADIEKKGAARSKRATKIKVE